MTVLLTVVVAGGGRPQQVMGQSASAPECGLEQRLAPWRVTCHRPLHFAAPSSVREAAPLDLATFAASLSVFGRSTFASDRDNGAVWSGRGLSTQLAFGVGGSIGPIRYGLFPALHWAQNLDFVVTDAAVADHSPYAYPWVKPPPRIDWPQRMGSGAVRSMSPGQSFFEISGWSHASIGGSTENIWWGPSRRYPMLLGATADGFPHVYGRSPSVSLGPIRTTVRAVVGRLTESQHFDQVEGNDRSLLSTLRVEMGLSWLPGSQLAVTTMVRQPLAPGLSFGEVVSLLIPLSTVQSGRGEGAVDGIGAVTLVLPVTSLGVRLHGTWGRGDFFVDAEDLLTEPDHNQFWSIGLHQEWQRPNDSARWALSVEHASTAATPPQFTRIENFSAGIYRHDNARQGHTNLGQLLGASIGPGTRATYFSVDRTLDESLLGVLVERVLWDIDSYSVNFRDEFRGGQDREWLLGARLGSDLALLQVGHLRLDAFGGASIRWNRQYVRFTGDQLDHPERETNFWLDLRLSWTPDRGEGSGRE